MTIWDDDGEELRLHEAWAQKIHWSFNNPEISVSDSRIGRLKDNSAGSTAWDVAHDFSRYLKSRGVDFLSRNGFFSILNSPGWSPFFDPFSSRVDGSSIAFRTSWDDAWDVFYNKRAKRWEVKKLERFDPSVHDGWKVIVPYLYKSYVESCVGVRRPISKELYGVNWLSEGFENLKQHVPTMAVFSGHRERDLWIGQFGSFNVALSWISTGVSASDAKKFANLGLQPQVISMMKRQYPDHLSNLETWINNDFELSVIKKNIQQNVSIKVALSWRGCEFFSDDDVANWVNAGFNRSEEAVEWKKFGFFPIEAREWIENGFSRADEAERWSALVGSATLSKRLRESGCSIRQENQSTLLQHNPTGTDLINFRELTLRYPRGASKIEEVLNDLSTPSMTFEASLAWRDAGFTLDEHIFWVGLGVDLNKAMPWLSSGFDLREFLSWKAININVSTASRYKKFGYGPRQSKSLIEQKVSPTRAVQDGIEPTGF